MQVHDSIWLYTHQLHPPSDWPFKGPAFYCRRNGSLPGGPDGRYRAHFGQMSRATGGVSYLPGFKSHLLEALIRTQPPQSLCKPMPPKSRISRISIYSFWSSIIVMTHPYRVEKVSFSTL